ncbi:major histocompatibility complex class I-related protein 1-like [Epinephelus lanceolatus]
MKKILLLLLFCHVSFPAKHSLKFFLTASSGVPKFPEFVGTAVLDEILLGSCDTNIMKVELKQEWLKELLENNPQQLKWYNAECSENLHNDFKATINHLKQQFNQTGGIHILQRMSGCEWDDETGEVNAFTKFGYNGEDFISLDLKALTWIALKPQAVTTKLRWDTDKAKLNFYVNYLNQTCPEWLKMYLASGKSSLLRTALPSVSLLQKSPSSPVTCHVTGFYPDRAMMSWKKDGEEIHEGMDHREILPNHDGTFQMSSDLNISSISPEDWSRYDCVFHLSGVKEDIITKLDKAVIRTNWVSPSQITADAVIGVVIGVLLLTVCITGVFIWRRNDNDSDLQTLRTLHHHHTTQLTAAPCED